VAISAALSSGRGRHSEPILALETLVEIDRRARAVGGGHGCGRHDAGRPRVNVLLG
jgi:hypothetical protein